MTGLNNAIYGAREHAMHHMQSQASRLHASGVVGVTVQMTVAHERDLTSTAIGTAIAAPARRPSDPGPRLAVDLADAVPVAVAQRPLTRR